MNVVLVRQLGSRFRPFTLTAANLCLQVIQKDLEDCEAHLTAVETLVSSSQSNRTQFEKHYAEWRHLHNTVKVRLTRPPRKSPVV